MADQQYCLRWNNHQNTLISVFDSLQERGCMVDCTLGAEGQSLQAHKVVLSACSPYLEDLLTKHYDKHPILILKDVRFEELKAMVDYMYRGEVNVAHDKLNLFLRAAESLQIKGLSDSGTDPPDTGGTAGGTKRTSKGAPVSVRSNQQLTVRSTNLADDSRDGSVSPSQRKRRRRRGSDESDNDSSSNVADGKQSSAAAAPVTGPSVLNQDLLPTVPASVPADALLSSIMESAETDTATDSGLYANAVTPSSQENVILDKGSSDVLVQPKTEYLDDDTQDLALGDDDSVAGPSHSRSGNFMNDTDMFMADQDGSNNAQDTRADRSTPTCCCSTPATSTVEVDLRTPSPSPGRFASESLIDSPTMQLLEPLLAPLVGPLLNPFAVLEAARPAPLRDVGDSRSVPTSLATPMAAPLATPMAPPMAAPMTAPMAAPLAAPMAASMAAPMAGPMGPPRAVLDRVETDLTLPKESTAQSTKCSANELVPLRTMRAIDSDTTATDLDEDYNFVSVESFEKFLFKEPSSRHCCPQKSRASGQADLQGDKYKFHSDRCHRCQHCPLKPCLGSHADLLAHMDSYHAGRHFRCSTCSVGFRTSAKLQTHLLDDHPVDAPAEGSARREGTPENTALPLPLRSSPTKCTPTEETLAAETLTETLTETPAAEAPTEDTPAEVATTEDTPAEDATTEDKLAEDATTVESPAEDATTEDKPAADATTEDKPAADAPVEDTPAADASFELTPSKSKKYSCSDCLRQFSRETALFSHLGLHRGGHVFVSTSLSDCAARLRSRGASTSSSVTKDDKFCTSFVSASPGPGAAPDEAEEHPSLDPLALTPPEPSQPSQPSAGSDRLTFKLSGKRKARRSVTPQEKVRVLPRRGLGGHATRTCLATLTSPPPRSAKQQVPSDDEAEAAAAAQPTREVESMVTILVSSDDEDVKAMTTPSQRRGTANQVPEDDSDADKIISTNSRRHSKRTNQVPEEDSDAEVQVDKAVRTYSRRQSKLTIEAPIEDKHDKPDEVVANGVVMLTNSELSGGPSHRLSDQTRKPARKKTKAGTSEPAREEALKTSSKGMSKVEIEDEDVEGAGHNEGGDDANDELAAIAAIAAIPDSPDYSLAPRRSGRRSVQPTHVLNPFAVVTPRVTHKIKREVNEKKPRGRPRSRQSL